MDLMIAEDHLARLLHRVSLTFGEAGAAQNAAPPQRGNVICRTWP